MADRTMHKDDCRSNLEIGLIFLKTKVTDKGVCLSSWSEFITPDAIPSCKLHDKWIVAAGNSCTVYLEKDPNWLINSNDDDKVQNLKRLCQEIHCSSIASPDNHVSLLDQPWLQNNIVEIHLDSVFKNKTTILSLELFKCVNVRVLSLRNNNLMSLPAEIGRLSQLRTLILTENCLTFNTIPFTLTFCSQLKELYLDHNLLDALPGFLLDIPQLETVYRHGNHNYFKSTFMWYYSAERERVMPLRPNQVNKKSEGIVYQPQSLESHSIKTLIAAKMNFFTPGLLPVTLQDHVAKVYTTYKICAYCSAAFHSPQIGYRVFTFKSPYAGNTSVPFEHWTCCRECGVALEEPAHRQELIQARKSDNQYQQYIKSIEDQFNRKPDKRLGLCVVI